MGGRDAARRQPSVVVRDLHVRYRTDADVVRHGRGRHGGHGHESRWLSGRGAVVEALRGVSFTTYEGESVGIIGQNGSGKSTLLRLVAGLERPTSGEVWASSQPALLGVNAALQPELSGAQNVRLGCLAMGLTPAEVDRVLPDILEVSAIGQAIRLPMKTYSSGMAARLRFAIAVATRSRILLIDEALATGDATFKERSEERLRERLSRAGTVFLVTHVGKVVEQQCARAIWLHDGEVVLDGPAYETAQKYRWWAWNVAQGKHSVADALLGEARSSAST
ncbi:ABC transporter ATP-binding protein [Segeticoccus rhizosphaerae]|uniref:ABC transporter ATP-binding protein n=1 Tax=Segeticoccus rhizosphaerae TaxID=1104777 RepID=UPI001265426A|nr:ABC transporter ATP-binding protein [Segeticoccus rhizosphaerae]